MSTVSETKQTLLIIDQTAELGTLYRSFDATHGRDSMLTRGLGAMFMDSLGGEQITCHLDREALALAKSSLAKYARNLAKESWERANVYHIINKLPDA